MNISIIIYNWEFGYITRISQNITFQNENVQNFRKIFDEFYAQAANKIKAFIAEEQQKRADAEYVSKKVNQWASEQKSQKIKASKSKELKRKITKLAKDVDGSIPANDFILRFLRCFIIPLPAPP